MKMPHQIKQLRQLIDTNSPVILTGMAVAGLGASVYFTFKGAKKSANDLAARETSLREITGTTTVDGLPKFQEFQLTWKNYAPAAAAVVGTTACMVMATKIGLNRTAAITGALIIAERNNEQYRDKVKEILGDNKHVKVVDAVAADKVAAMGPLPAPSEGQQIFIDNWSQRPISTTMEGINKVLNEFNKEMLYGDYCSLNEFYSKLGLTDVQEGDDIGWNIGGGKDDLLELVFTTVLKDDRAVVVFSFDHKPMPGFRQRSVDV